MGLLVLKFGFVKDNPLNKNYVRTKKKLNFEDIIVAIEKVWLRVEIMLHLAPMD